MSKELITRTSAAPIAFTSDEIATIKDTVAKDATDSELKLFLHQCKRTGLDPFSRQIYFIKRRVWNSQTRGYDDRATIQSSIDGFRLVAQRSKKYRGQTLPQFLDDEGNWHEVWTKSGYPIAAKVGVHHADFKEPLYAIAKWTAFAQVSREGEPTAMWKKMPDHMLAKCAEALALRKAFPNDLSGIYIEEEMEQADEPEPVNYRVERIVPAEDDDEQSEPISSARHADTIEAAHVASTPKLAMPAPDMTALRIEIATLLSKGFGYTMLGKDADEVRAKVQLITGHDLIEENFPAIIANLQQQIKENAERVEAFNKN